MSETSISPEDDGIPKYADDESSAYDLGDRPSFEDSPAALPVSDPEVLPPEEIGPEEEADLSESDPSEEAAELDHESYVDAQSGVGVGDDGDLVFDVEPVDVQPVNTNVDVRPPDEPAEDTDVTLYEVDDGGDPVGRLVESESNEPGAADDSHEIEGLSPEEAAMHITQDVSGD
jgi:hypothetical protein